MRQRVHNGFTFPILMLVSLSLSGCYTLLKHPPATDSPETNDFSRCIDCHGGLFHAGRYDPSYGGAWWDFYTVPWWYDEVFIETDEGSVPASRAMFDRTFIYRDGQPAASPPTMRPPRTGEAMPPQAAPAEEGTKSDDERAVEPATRRDSVDRKRSDDNREQSRDTDDKRDADDSTDDSKDRKRK
jgi:hypothetical protein